MVEPASAVANLAVGTLPASAVIFTASISGPPLNVSQAGFTPSKALTSGVELLMQPVREIARAEEIRIAVIFDTETTFFDFLQFTGLCLQMPCVWPQRNSERI